MKVLSWNVNGLRSIVKKGFKSKIKDIDADIICIQEIKTRTGIRGFNLEGYYSYYNFATISGYSGVATFTKKKPNNVYWGLHFNKNDESYDINEDSETRVLTLEYNDFYVVNVYVPHPQTRNERKEYRDTFNRDLIELIKQLKKSVIICGDFNITHKNIDIYDVSENEHQNLFKIEQRESFDELLNTGLLDSFRFLHPQMRKYTLKANNIQKLETDTYGWRIDYILISKNMKKEIREANILNEIDGSDHCPIELVLKLSNGNNNIFNEEKEITIPKEYIKKSQDFIEKLQDDSEGITVKTSYDNELLGNLWESYDFEKAEEVIFKMQCDLTKATFNNDNKKRIEIQEKIVNSSEAKMLAVKQVSENAKTSSGIDGILWEKASDKMKAAISLNSGEYKSSPLRQYVFYDQKSGKERKVGIPTIYDRAMQVLYFYSLEPVAEARADRKSFAFRKGKSLEQMHAHIIKTLSGTDAPEWILVSDIKSYYDSISHKWIMQNIPMDKQVLNQFLKSKYVFNGELFDTDTGISLGCNISTLIGNMTLDGLQKELYKMQEGEEIDFYNGYCLRFADDILVTTRTREDAVKAQEIIKEFAFKRGLKLAENKTKIVNIKQGFDFISRFYYKSDGRIKCVPSKNAIEKFKEEMNFLIFNNKDRWTTKELIDNINRKITGFTTYHKVEESQEAFRHLDVIINALLLKMAKENHPTYTVNQLKCKYWEKDAEGRYVFSTPDKRNRFVKNMADTILIDEKPMDLKKNVFLDREYFNQLEDNRNIQNITGKYRKVFDMQDGKCYFCSKDIKIKDEKKIIFKNKKGDKTCRNLAYIHADCENQLITKIKTTDSIDSMITARELFKQITNDKKKQERNSKFKNLSVFFHNTRRNKVKLSFITIEKILGFKLCDSAYKYKSYFSNKKSGMINRAWTSQGFEIENVDMDKQEIEFKRVQVKKKINVPNVLYKTNLPDEAIYEANNFFIHFLEKYRLK